MKLDIYLNYAGNCQQAFRFYEQHLGGKITMMMTHGQGPNAGKVPDEQKNTILHARLELGNTVVMGADIPKSEPMRSAYLTLTVDSEKEAERGTLAREHLSAAPPHPTAAPRRAAPCTRIKAAAAQKQLPQSSRAQPVCRARRARASGQGAPSNKRLELAAPGGQRRIPFVTNQARRRSSSAIR